jgi:hypothetical protein
MKTTRRANVWRRLLLCGGVIYAILVFLISSVYPEVVPADLTIVRNTLFEISKMSLPESNDVELFLNKNKLWVLRSLRRNHYTLFVSGVGDDWIITAKPKYSRRYIHSIFHRLMTADFRTVDYPTFRLSNKSHSVETIYGSSD